MKSLFGYIIVNKPEMKFKEFDLYHAYYCGLCRSLKKCYGMAGQISLSYDMTFLAMLLSGLYEPEETRSRGKVCGTSTVQTYGDREYFYRIRSRYECSAYHVQV